MFLSDAAKQCIEILEQAGFAAYAVGGCVRDSLLGLTPHDYDLCTNALPSETAELFSAYTCIHSGEKHGTIGVVIGKEVVEITTFRTEGGYRDSRHPDWVKFVSHVEEDLSRRDFTVNAIAYNPKCGYIDPFGGQADLQNRILRAVGNPQTRFSEDALRILRGVRFAVRFGLTPEADTLTAMQALAPLMDSLARERVFDELCKLLPLLSATDLLRFARVLTQVVPPLAPCVGFQQHNPHHLYDVYTHIAQVVEATPPCLTLRWASLLHDCGKPACFALDEAGKGHFNGHAQVSARLAEDLLLQLKAPTALREQVVFLIAHHMTPLEPDKRLLRRKLGKYGKQALLDLLALQQADFGGKGVKGTNQFQAVRALLDEVLAEDACFTTKDLAVNGRDLQELGYPSDPRMGCCLNWLLEQVQDEYLPNDRRALLEAAAAFYRAE